jgi:voltage-gated sodium channel
MTEFQAITRVSSHGQLTLSLPEDFPVGGLVEVTVRSRSPEEPKARVPLNAAMSVWGWLRDLLIHDYFILSVVIINTFALMYEHSQSVPEQTPMWLAVDYVCVSFFCIEIVLKARKSGWAAYWENPWNKFDFLVTLASLPGLLTPFSWFGGSSTILILRLGRLFRLFRFLKFIPNRDHLMMGIPRALKASVGVFFALVLINLILSLSAMFLFRQEAPEYFGDPFTASYTMFRVFTIEGWYEIPNTIAQHTQTPYMKTFVKLYFMGSVLTGGMMGFGLANAVFVDQMTSDNNDKLESRIENLAEEVRNLKIGLQAKESDARANQENS